jgi:hypothetical protein
MKSTQQLERDLIALSGGLRVKTAFFAGFSVQGEEIAPASPGRLALLFQAAAVPGFTYSPNCGVPIENWMNLPTGLNWVLIRAQDYPGLINRSWLGFAPPGATLSVLDITVNGET